VVRRAPGAVAAALRYNDRPVDHGSPDMIVLEGAPALSPFRRERLQARLQALHPDLRLLGAWPVYWVEPDAGAALGSDPPALDRLDPDALAAGGPTLPPRAHWPRRCTTR